MVRRNGRRLLRLVNSLLVTGDIDMTGAHDLDEAVTKLLAAHPASIDTVIIDLSQASALSAVAVGVLHAAAQACRCAITVRIVATGLMLRSLQLSNTGELIVHSGLEDALAAGQATEQGALACTLSVWPTHVLITAAGECNITAAPGCATRCCHQSADTHPGSSSAWPA